MITLFRKNEEFNPAESGIAFSLAVLVPYVVLLLVGTVFFACGGSAESDVYTYLVSVAAQLSYLTIILFVARQKGGLRAFRAGKFHFKYILVGLLLCYLQKEYGLISLPGNYIINQYPVEVRFTDVIITFTGIAIIGYLIAILPVSRKE